MDLKTILELLALINGATPGIATLIATIRGPGGELIEVTLDKADVSFQDNLDQIEDWESENP
jgi:hypothetical protein